MFDFFKRHRLQRQGYSCGRKRREKTSSEWMDTIRTSPFVRWLIVAAFLCALGVLARTFPDLSAFQMLGPGLGMITLLTVLALSLVHMRFNLPETWARNSRVLLVYGTVLLQLAAFMGVCVLTRRDEAASDATRVFLAPAALAPMLLTLLLGRRHGIFGALHASLWSGLMVEQSVALPCVLAGLITGLTGMATVRHLRKRAQLLRSALVTGAAAIVAAASLGLIAHPWSPAAAPNAWQAMAAECGMIMGTALFTTLLVGGLLPVMEAIFRITTAISWIELADLNHPLLRRMTLEAPGTYHHSLMVANLAEAAAEAVGADTTQCRVCSYFHDIGKLVKPEYCIENITDENPHDDLTPSMSALVVMAHVKDGVDLACRHKLNAEIIDVIQQHHGTSLVYYFYRRALDQQEAVKKAVAEGKASPEDIPEVSESSFRYPGPRPASRESAIISLADSVESASRSLAKPTPQKIEALVDEIIRGRLRDGQLDECDLTMRDLTAIRESFTKTLRTSLHRRIPYPEEKPAESRARTTDTEIVEKPRPQKAAKQGASPAPPAPPVETGPPPTAIPNVIPMPLPGANAGAPPQASGSASG